MPEAVQTCFKTILHLQPVGQGRGSPERLGFNLEHWSLGVLPPFSKSSRKEAAGVPRSGRQLVRGDGSKFHFLVPARTWTK